MLKKLRITWFGGEPLLNKKAIKKISDKIVPIIKDRKIKYYSSILTNGSLIDVDFLKENKIHGVQVTLDGIGEVYAEYKGVNIENYEVVMSNIRKIVLDGTISLGIRINCDRKNKDSVFELIKTLDNEGILERTYTNLAPIVSGQESDLSDEEFFELKMRYYRYLFNKGYKSILNSQLHGARFMSCGFMGYGSYVIDVDGTLKKCERDVGLLEKSVGDVRFGMYYNEVEREYQTNDILEKCHKCSVYPVCRGGCRKYRDQGKDIDCSLFKKELNELLKLIIMASAINVDSFSKGVRNDNDSRC